VKTKTISREKSGNRFELMCKTHQAAVLPLLCEMTTAWHAIGRFYPIRR